MFLTKLINCLYCKNAVQDKENVTQVHSSSATTVLSSVKLHLYRGQFDWQNIDFMTMYDEGETNLLPMPSQVTIKYSSISMTSYWYFVT